MFLYVIGPEIGHQKIGISKNVEKRLKSLQTGNSNKLFIHHTEEVSDCQVRLIEKKIHKELNYIKKTGEWFEMTKEDAIAFLQFFIIRYGDDPTLKHL